MGYAPEDLRFAAVRASHTHPSDTADAIGMPHEPLSSADTSIHRWTSWPQRGKDQWIEVDLREPTRVQRLSVYWFDDDRGIRVPKSWHLETPGPSGWQPVRPKPGQTFTTAPHQHNSVEMDEAVTGTIRIVITPHSPDHCVGILSVRVGGDAAGHSGD
jgi:hypothetical protein